MDKKKVPTLGGIFFLISIIASPFGLSEETCQLSSQSKVSLNKESICFRQIYDTLNLALLIYKRDAIGGYSKERLVEEYGSAIFTREVRFDLRNIDMGKKGWTRYYPFWIGDKCFIIRIFLTEEGRYQPQTEVLYEAVITRPAVTIQVLPGVNAILKDCRIKPLDSFSYYQAERSP